MQNKSHSPSAAAERYASDTSTFQLSQHSCAAFQYILIAVQALQKSCFQFLFMGRNAEYSKTIFNTEVHHIVLQESKHIPPQFKPLKVVFLNGQRN